MEHNADTLASFDPEFMSATADVPETLGGDSNAPAGSVEAPAPEAFPLTVEMLEMVIALPFNMIAMTIGDGGEFWSLKPMESASLAQAWLPVAQKLLAMWGMSEGGAVIAAAMMTAATIGPRVFQEKSRRAALTVATETVRSGGSYS